eukprot:6184445-Pleurochrysis_carterae.AAC.5
MFITVTLNHTSFAPPASGHDACARQLRMAPVHSFPCSAARVPQTRHREIAPQGGAALRTRM